MVAVAVAVAVAVVLVVVDGGGNGQTLVGFWIIQGQSGKIQEKIQSSESVELTTHAETKNVHAFSVFRPQYFLYLPVFWGRDAQNTDPVLSRTLDSGKKRIPF